MKQIILVLFAFVITAFSEAQEVSMVSAKIIDAKTNEPIEFVNVGFVGKGIGAISNTEGSFYLVFEADKIDKRDVLQISAIGYETQIVAYNELPKYSSYKTPIFLTPKAYDLDQVVLNSVKREKKVLGHPDVTAYDMGYWRNVEALGGEIASVIQVKKKNTKLLNLKFKIIDNMSDSIRVRVNVYDFERAFPGKNLLGQNIFHTISRKKGFETIDLQDYNITVDDDIVVSLELVEVYGNAIYFAIAASAYGGLSFTREISQDDWKIYKKVGIGFSLESSFPVKGEDKSISSRPRPEKIHLYWDTSIHLEDRNLKEELTLLKKYIQTLDNVEVVVDKFSDQIYERRIFTFSNGKSHDLLNYLESSQYNGAARYESLLQDNTHGANLILAFTNGDSFFEPLSTKINVPTFIVNSMTSAANEILQDLAFNSGGVYLNLDKISPKKALDYLLYKIEDTSVYEKEGETIEDFYYGVVYNEDGPIRDAVLSIRGGFQEVRTKSNGSYKIVAEPGDVLEIEALGMSSKDTLLGPFRKTHIPLKADREILKEVIVDGKLEKEEVYVETSFGRKKRESVGFSTLQTYTSEDISPDEATLADILRSKPGIVIEGYDNINVKFRFKKTNMATLQDKGKTFPALVIDGLIYDQRYQDVPYIDTQTIETITLLKSNLSTVGYGQLAAYGAIVVTTNNNPGAIPEKVKQKSALAQGNEYTESIPTIEEARTTQPKSSYLLALENCSSFEEAKLLYHKQLKNEKNNIDYFVTTATYFEKWNSDFSNTIRSNIAVVASENTKALKILAYETEKNGDLETTQYIYEQIVNLSPNLAQSYRDLAQIYTKTGSYKLAGSLYKQMIFNTIPNVDFIDFQDILLNEFQHLLKHHKSNIDFEDLPNNLLSLDYKKDVRVVLEWNQPGVEFDVQFVNPDNKYYNFSHTQLINESLLEREISEGIFMKEFIIEDGEKGRWLINIRYEGQKSTKIPVFLKYTLYQNYGLPNETNSIKVIQLEKFQDKVTLDTIIN